MDSAASPHHRMLFGESGNVAQMAVQFARVAGRDGVGGRAGPGQPGGLAGASTPPPPLREAVQSGDVVRSRMDAGASPHSASGDDPPLRSGENAHGKRRLTTSPGGFRKIRKRALPVAGQPTSVGPATGSPSGRENTAGGRAGGSSPRSFTNRQKRSGDVVRTRMNPGVSPLRAGTFITRCGMW